MDTEALLGYTIGYIESTKKKYIEACESCDFEKANNYHWWLKYYCGMRSILQQKPSGHIARQTLTYRISSMFLNDVRNTLVDGSGNENECYCAGVLDTENNLALPIQILRIDLAKQSVASARGDVFSICHTLSELDRWEHPMLMFCHSHPGKGPGSTCPSGTDLGTHRDLEVSYEAIGAIFSQDGYVRFISAGKKFQVEIFGAGVVKVDDNVYRIQG